jgi:hypothetical protein
MAKFNESKEKNYFGLLLCHKLAINMAIVYPVGCPLNILSVLNVGSPCYPVKSLK